MSKQTLNNGESGLTIRGKINDNFTELFQTEYPFHKSNATVALTGSTSETLLASKTVPAGTIGVNDSIEIECTFTCTGGSGTRTARVRVAGTAGTGGTLFLITQGAATIMGMKMEKDIEFKGALNSTLTINNTNAGNSDVISATGAPSTQSVDFTNEQVISITGQLGNAGDSMTLEKFQIRIVKA